MDPGSFDGRVREGLAIRPGELMPTTLLLRSKAAGLHQPAHPPYLSRQRPSLGYRWAPLSWVRPQLHGVALQ